jgi:hypothetical protein
MDPTMFLPNKIFLSFLIKCCILHGSLLQKLNSLNGHPELMQQVEDLLEDWVICISVCWDDSHQAKTLKHQQWSIFSTMTKVTSRIFVEPFFPKNISFLKPVLLPPVVISYIQQAIALPIGMPGHYSGNSASVIGNLTGPGFDPCMHDSQLFREVSC